MSIVHHKLITFITVDGELAGVETHGVALVLLLQTQDTTLLDRRRETTFIGSIFY